MGNILNWIEKIKLIKAIWDGKNNFLLSMGVILIAIGILLRKFKFIIKKSKLNVTTWILILTGILLIFLSFGRGFGIGFGKGGTTNNNSEEIDITESDDEEVRDEIPSLEEIQEKAVSENGFKIIVHENSVYIDKLSRTGILCSDFEEFENLVDEIYKDGMIVEVEDNYAYNKPYVEVLKILREHGISYTLISYDEVEYP